MPIIPRNILVAPAGFKESLPWHVPFRQACDAPCREHVSRLFLCPMEAKERRICWPNRQGGAWCIVP